MGLFDKLFGKKSDYAELKETLENAKKSFLIGVTGKPELDELLYKMKEEIVIKSKYVLNQLYINRKISDEEHKELASKIDEVDKL